MRAVVHIGMPKTGTSTIQDFLWLNRKALAERGVAYDRQVPRQRPQPEYVMAAMRGQERKIQGYFRRRFNLDRPGTTDAAHARLTRLLRASGAETWVVSSEYLCQQLRSARAIRTLDALLAEGAETRDYVLYIRRQDLWCESNYSQTLRSGSTRTMADYVKKAKLPNYAALVALWEGALGHPITIRLFEPSEFGADGLIGDFCAATGLPLDGMAMPARINESLDVASADRLRRFNIRLRRWSSLSSARGPRIARKALRFWLERSAGKGEKPRLSEIDRRRILARAAASNAALCRARFPDRATLFNGEPPYPPETAPPETPAKLTLATN